MEPPDDEGVHAGRPGLEHGEVADAGLVDAPAVVDDEHVPGLRGGERLEEDVDAPGMTGRQGAAGEQRTTGHDGADPGGCHAERHADAYARVGQERRREPGDVGDHG